MKQDKMSRGKMTAMICATMVICTAIAVFALKPEEYDPYAECKDFFGNYDVTCQADLAAQRMSGRQPGVPDLLADPVDDPLSDPIR